MNLKHVAAAAAALFVAGTSLALEIEPSTSFVVVKEFYVPSQKGGFEPYQVNGFYEPGAAANKPRFYLLPRIQVLPGSLQAISKAGKIIADPTSEDLPRIDVLRLALSYDAKLPTAEQGIGIGAAINGQAINAYVPKPVRLPNGAIPYNPSAPLVSPAVNGDVIKAINEDYEVVEKARAEQQQMLKRWEGFTRLPVNLDQLTVTLLIDSEPLAERRLPGTAILTGGKLPELVVRDVSEKILNRLLEGSYEVSVKFSFKDSKVAAIDASFDLQKSMSRYVEETRRALTSEKSTSWGVFNIGGRRSSLRQSLSDQFKEQATQDSRASTVIVMDDVDDAMLKTFEEQFFPPLTLASTIENHMKAADAAKLAGNAALASAHMKYIAMLQAADPKAEMDAAGAATALAAGDYATFIAKGVRFSSTSTIGASSYHRVLTQNVTEGQQKAWAQLKRISTKREISVLVTPPEAREFLVYVGFCGMRQVTARVPNGALVPMAFVTCVNEGSPAHGAGIAPGTLFDRIAGKVPTNGDALWDGLKNIRPGSQVSLRRVDPSPMGWPVVPMSVTSASGWPKP